MAAAAPSARAPRAPRAVIVPTLPIADAVRQTFAAAVAAMTHYEAAAAAGEIEPLHQMRVAARRLRAIVELFAGTIHGSRVRAYRRDLPWLGHAAGAVRERDVIASLIRECGARFDPALAAALTPLGEALAAERNAAHARFVAELRARRYARMCERLAHPLLRRALPAINAGGNAPALIAPLARSVRRAGKRIGRDAPPELFHRLRVRLKRLRYALEMLAEMGGKRARCALIRLEQMQDLLGLQQDVVATIAWLRAYAAEASGVAPATLMAVGAMLQALVTRRAKLAARACRRWRKIVRSGVLDDALDEISRAAEAQLDAESQAAAARVQTAAASIDAAGAAAAVNRQGPAQPLGPGAASSSAAVKASVEALPLAPQEPVPAHSGAVAAATPDAAVSPDKPAALPLITIPTNG